MWVSGRVLILHTQGPGFIASNTERETKGTKDPGCIPAQGRSLQEGQNSKTNLCSVGRPFLPPEKIAFKKKAKRAIEIAQWTKVPDNYII